MKLKVGQGFIVKRRIADIYGVILNFTEDTVEYCEVESIIDARGYRHKMYDDKDAVYGEDKDNVRLRSCPPPFSDLFVGDKDINGAYAIAVTTDDGVLTPKLMSMFAFEQKAEIVDKGECVKPEDMRAIKHHPWPHQPEKEKVYSSAASNAYREIPFVSDDMNLDFDDIHK